MLTDQDGATLLVNQSGTYSVEVIGQILDQNGNLANQSTCTSFDNVTITEEEGSVIINLTEGELVKEISYCPDVETIPNYTVTLAANAEGLTEEALSYQWYMNGTEITGAIEATYSMTYEEEGEYVENYSVDVMSGNCVFSSAPKEIEVSIKSYEGGCVISQGISPNNSDGLNDCLDLSFLNNRTGIESLKVYNRYGKLVFDQDAYVDTFCGQDQNGNQLTTGTYYYVLILKDEDPVFGKVKKSWIYINQEK
ncbi:gliding motility-associated C-terminal domain-containing protein [Mesonia aestuariivivens]|uniref:Gliding motility-associated C-terminal domain-containing protein n=1 Tax=Mesonia aestuariivivens TaxID=2796128 RepID=A0ABS6VXI7_9FLAO|nr:gliding motility-associated C-terminal domain-containing protein [Mesonia aestuariivivens]MBW2960300.1 gliding motility-associated C-terminal domain-containing protein [Mesonia aestuariivivens]